MDPRMMREWLNAQGQKKQVSEADMQRKRLGINEQLNAQEETYAKEHKHMLSSMIKEYGKDKGTKVFYATVRNKVKEINENFGSGVVPTAAARTAAGMPATAASLQDKNYYYVKPIRQKAGPVSKEMEQDLAFRQYVETAGPEYDSRKQQHQEDLGRAKQEAEDRSKLDQLKTKLNVPAKDLNNPYRV